MHLSRSSRPETPIRVLNFRLLLASAFWLALLLELWVSVRAAIRADASMVRALADHLLYFTTLTTGFCAAVLTVRAAPRWDSALVRFFRRHGTTTGATVSLILVGLIYHFMLPHSNVAAGLPEASERILHYILPVLFTGFWWEYVPRGALALRDIPRWMLFPGLYAAYVFVRGALTQNYQYPFVDVTALGLVTAVRNAALTVLVFLIIAATLVLVNRFAGNPSRSEH